MAFNLQQLVQLAKLAGPVLQTAGVATANPGLLAAGQAVGTVAGMLGGMNRTSGTAGAAPTSPSFQTTGLTPPDMFDEPTPSAAGGGFMSGLGNALGAFGGGGQSGGGAFGGALGSMLAGGFGGGTESVSQTNATSRPKYFGQTLDSYLNALGVNRAQQQERNQLLMGLPAMTASMLQNFLSGTAAGRALGGGMQGYQPKNPFDKIKPYPIGSQDYSGDDPIWQEILDDVKNNPGTYRPEWADTLEGRALGGPIHRTKPYLVGEQGPERYIPPMGGQMRTLGAGGPQVAQLQAGGYVVPNPQTMRTIAPVRPGIDPGKGSTTGTNNSLIANPALPQQGAISLASGSATAFPEAFPTRNAFSPELIAQMTARGIEGANIQNRNQNAAYAGQANAMGMVGPQIAAVLAQGNARDAQLVGAQTATDTSLSGMNLGMQQQQMGTQYYLQMLQMLLNGLYGSNEALFQPGQKSKSSTKSQGRGLFG